MKFGKNENELIESLLAKSSNFSTGADIMSHHWLRLTDLKLKDDPVAYSFSGQNSNSILLKSSEFLIK